MEIRLRADQQLNQVHYRFGSPQVLHVGSNLSGSSLRHFVVIYSILERFFDGVDEKGFVKQNDVGQCLSLIEVKNELR